MPTGASRGNYPPEIPPAAVASAWAWTPSPFRRTLGSSSEVSELNFSKSWDPDFCPVLPSRFGFYPLRSVVSTLFFQPRLGWVTAPEGVFSGLNIQLRASSGVYPEWGGLSIPFFGKVRRPGSAALAASPPGSLLPGPRDPITVPRRCQPLSLGPSGVREGSRLPVEGLPHRPPVQLPRRIERQAPHRVPPFCSWLARRRDYRFPPGSV